MELLYHERFMDPTTVKINLRKLNGIKNQLSMFAHGKKDIMAIDIPEGTLIVSETAKKGSNRREIIPCQKKVQLQIFGPQLVELSIIPDDISETWKDTYNFLGEDPFETKYGSDYINCGSIEHVDLWDGTKGLKTLHRSFQCRQGGDREVMRFLNLSTLINQKAIKFKYTKNPRDYDGGLDDVFKIIRSIKFTDK